MSKDRTICSICDHPMEKDDDIIHTYTPRRMGFGLSKTLGTASVDWPSGFIHLACILDPRGPAR